MDKNVFEIVTGHTNDGKNIVASWMELIKGKWFANSPDYTDLPENKCCYSVSEDYGKTWSKALYYKHESMDIAGNPTIKTLDNGIVVLVCMSVKLDYSEGYLDFTISKDFGQTCIRLPQ
ncbi:MAG: hypothetical protein A2381_19855 [Bdellovibrionales bacterium RIFOXYB1_FULL_37_110]|nr:MAG: hypothetical protein A2181_03490 [Bdellovibrionales bacterium RIFOXYA1_FULL_38_20]OFZ50993.1 MAG: hypothetical protein A2417_19640 [Bdellovibrionales bacterium RIFOXYC1_FULL_37_79]OFZ60205.1 MAG: hypothetical protein A2381_19855 [Bdellovibrionales bacterium RIFOXYB1_FULL_37_110]OFZ61567.1 MAG: hypothetical protein A2577_10295 [Bdellovibrionales bacterium RIFOXYD1_FULL_36_51]